jgi:hypothetical protein
MERPRFEELDYQETPIGAVSLRRRTHPETGEDVFEVKRDDDFLMSSLFTTAEVELARMALAHAPDRPLDVVLGGLGLGCTAAAVLDDERVSARARRLLRPHRGAAAAGAACRRSPTFSRVDVRRHGADVEVR